MLTLVFRVCKRGRTRPFQNFTESTRTSIRKSGIPAKLEKNTGRFSQKMNRNLKEQMAWSFRPIFDWGPRQIYGAVVHIRHSQYFSTGQNLLSSSLGCPNSTSRSNIITFLGLNNTEAIGIFNIYDESFGQQRAKQDLSMLLICKSQV